MDCRPLTEQQQRGGLARDGEPAGALEEEAGRDNEVRKGLSVSHGRGVGAGYFGCDLPVIFLKAIIPGGAGGDLFAEKVHVQGHMDGSVYVAPYEAIRKKRAPEAAKVRSALALDEPGTSIPGRSAIFNRARYKRRASWISRLTTDRPLTTSLLPGRWSGDMPGTPRKSP